MRYYKSLDYIFILQYAVCHIYKCGFTSWLQYTLVVENLRSVEDYQAGRAKGYKARLLGENVINLVSPIYKLTASKRWLEALKVSKESFQSSCMIGLTMRSVT